MRFYAPGLASRKFRPSPSEYSAWPHESGKICGKCSRNDTVSHYSLQTEHGEHMKILFITAHKYLPQLYGGLQTSTDEVCKGLLGRGHRVCVLAGFMPVGWLGFTTRVKMRLRSHFTRDRVARDTGLGYPVW